VTIQWSIIGKGTDAHNFQSLVGLSAYNVTVHHNLYINGDDRMPKVAGPNGATSPWSRFVGDVRNNLVWNFRLSGTQVRHGGVANVINNYYWSAGSSADKTIWVAEGGAAYASGNYSKNGWNVDQFGNRSSAYAAAPVTTTDAVTAAQQVVAHAGARGPRFGLDSVDQAHLGQVKLN
jgi:pectate lyase